MKYTFTRKQIVNAFNNKILDDDNFLTYLLSTTSKDIPMNQKSLDKKKTKELDWEIELINSGKHLADILEQYNGNRQCKLCGAEPEKQSEWVIFLVKKLLTQQRTELEQQKVKVVWNSVCEQIKKDTIEQILNLECLVDEIPTMSEPEIEVDNKEIRNQLREEIIKEIKKLRPIKYNLIKGWGKKPSPIVSDKLNVKKKK